MPQRTNWAGNLTYRGDIQFPESVSQLQELIAKSPKVRPLGTRHCFNTIADTGGVLVSAQKLPTTMELDAPTRIARVSAHLRYGDIAQWLHDSGFALANLASLPHISIAGAIATGTHGSGDQIGTLSSAVAGLEIVRADGSVVWVRRGDPDFAGLVVGLGAAGMVLTVELDVVPTFTVSQHVYEQLPWESLAHYDAITALGYSVSLFTTWAGPGIDQVWVKRRADDAAAPPQVHGALPAAQPRHPLPGIDPMNCTAQLGQEGPWFDRLPHFRLEFTPSHGAELQSEYLVPRENAGAAFEVLRELHPKFAPLLYVNEVRTLAADDLWLSPAYGRDTVGFHFTWQPRQGEVEAVLPELEAHLLPLGGRPHWGKLFAAQAPDLAPLYPQFAAAGELFGRWDPDRKFVNEFVAQKLGI